MKKTFGQRIRDLRDEKDFSLREFAKKLGGISAAHISDIELGRRYPSDDLLKKMADELGTTIEDLQSYDRRPPMEDLKRITESDPAFGYALRKLVDKEVTAEDLIKWAEEKPDRKR
jgi:transcriptional regulator with XRE-family HTH domain